MARKVAINQHLKKEQFTPECRIQSLHETLPNHQHLEDHVKPTDTKDKLLGQTIFYFLV